MYIGHMAEIPGSNPAAGAYRYYATDLIRSTRALFDQSKAQVAGYEYTPYGELYASSGTASTTHMFTGHDWDATSGLYFAPYRYYRPDLARWLSSDPAGDVDGQNRYLYASAGPLGKMDPLGTECVNLWGSVSNDFGRVGGYWFFPPRRIPCSAKQNGECMRSCALRCARFSAETDKVWQLVGFKCWGELIWSIPRIAAYYKPNCLCKCCCS